MAIPYNYEDEGNESDIEPGTAVPAFYPWGVSRFPVGPLPGYRTCRKAHALSIVRDEFRPAIP